MEAPNSRFRRDGDHRAELAVDIRHARLRFVESRAKVSEPAVVNGRQFQVVVPVQIGFSRGADGVVVKKELKRINALKGQFARLAAAD